MLAAAANCLPATLLFLGLGALAFAAVPRASAGIAYGFVSAVSPGSSSAPCSTRLIGCSASRRSMRRPCPAQPFEAVAAAVMLVAAVAAAAAALHVFARRDLTGA